MPYRKVKNKNFNDSIIVLFLVSSYINIFKFLEFFQIVVQLHKSNHYKN